MKLFQLDAIKSGMPGVSDVVASFLYEAALICLDKNNHSQSIILEIENDNKKEQFLLNWVDVPNNQQKQSWKDLNEAVEYGATAIATLFIEALTNFVIIGRLPQASRADYALQTRINYKNNIILPAAHLEVSGVLTENSKNTLKMRFNKKVKNAEASPAKNYPTYIFVVEFGKPKAKFGKI